MTAKSDLLTDSHAYDECMRIRQEETPSAMRAFCADVRAFSIPRHSFPPTYCTQNYISATTIRDITVLRSDLLSALTSAGLVPMGQRASSPELNVHSSEPALLKALLLAALYPRVARIALPRHAVKFARLASGTVARDVGAHEWRATDMRGGKRVWVHPASVLFTETRWRSGIVVSFERVETAGTGKVYLRDVTEVSFLLYSSLGLRYI
jgi:ATP-dependent RNA helicase DHX57